ncbi:MAG: sodium/solute symporter [Ignavibacteriales bacterium]|nr:sodium/solute symporter [Ignavibacteriales bacterium]
MGFSTLDYFIVIFYLVGIATLGIIKGGRQTSVKDYFLGGKTIPWWAVCFAIVATETSTLTFISIPGLAYLTNLNFLQVTFGYLIGRIVVSFVLLPVYHKGEIQTAYAYLANRFGSKTRNITSITFMFTRIIADGVRLFATAIPLTILLRGWNSLTFLSNEQVYIVSIIIMAFITLIYTYIGGVRAVIWTDVFQMFIYLIGAIASAIVILSDLPNGIQTVIGEAGATGKLNLLNFGFGSSFGEFFSNPYTLIASVLGGAFLSMASHGTDQLIVQRLLTVRTLRDGQRALIGSGIIVIFQFAIFLIIGILLYGYYGGSTLAELNVLKADEIFPKFIIEHIPTGLSGLIIAGLLAAAMSTLSGSVNSLASAVMLDIYKPYFGRNLSESRELSISRFVTLVCAVFLVGVAIFFIYSGSKSLVEIALSVASFTYGGLLGVFLLGVIVKKTRQTDAIISFFFGIVVMILVVIYGKIGWTWFTLIGSVVTITVGSIVSNLKSKSHILES